MDTHWIETVAASPWMPLVLFALVVGDAFLVVLPSETVVVALGALGAATGAPPTWVVVPVAALGALVGDVGCYLIGRSAGIDRWAWQRRPRIAAALDRARATIERRTAVLVFTARYVPFARIAVNLSAGAARIPLARYLPLSAAAGAGWAVFNVTIGGVVGAALPEQPLAAVIVSIPIAIATGLAVDAAVRRFSRSGASSTAVGADPGADPEVDARGIRGCGGPTPP